MGDGGQGFPVGGINAKVFEGGFLALQLYAYHETAVGHVDSMSSPSRPGIPLPYTEIGESIFLFAVSNLYDAYHFSEYLPAILFTDFSLFFFCVCFFLV